MIMSNLRKNFIYNILYQVLAIVLPLATSPYLSRVLGAEGMGIYSYTYSVAYYFFMFAMLGVNNYGNRCVARARGDTGALSRVFWSIWALQAVLALATTAGYIAYSVMLSGSPSVALIWVPYVLSAGLDVNWLFFGLEEFRVTVGRNFVVKLSTFALTFLLVRGDDALPAYIFLMSVSYLVSVMVLWPFVRKRVRSYLPSPCEVAARVKPNLVLFVPVVAVSLYTVLDRVMLGQMSSMEQTGYFESALKVAQMPFTLISALGTVMLPRVSNLMARGESGEARRYLGVSMWLALMLSSVFAFGLAGVADVFAPVFFGQGFEACGPLICALVAEMPFMAWANVLRTQYLIPAGRDRAYVLSVIVGAVVNVVVNVALIPPLGAMGAAMGTVAAEAAVCIVQAWSVAGELPQGRWLVENLPFFAIGAAMFTAVRALGSSMGASITTLAAQIALGGAVFAVLSFAWCRLSGNPHYVRVVEPLLQGISGRLSRR